MLASGFQHHLAQLIFTPSFLDHLLSPLQVIYQGSVSAPIGFGLCRVLLSKRRPRFHAFLTIDRQCVSPLRLLRGPPRRWRKEAKPRRILVESFCR
jgi:hypothetical protein